MLQRLNRPQTEAKTHTGNHEDQSIIFFYGISLRHKLFSEVHHVRQAKLYFGSCLNTYDV
jgi:hypothetical protein